ncbi:hypothetical protein H9Y04_41340 [Streptomyces sp. TRM66268-LWL]|uniref:DUF2191 domain-containing protein n=1 Tax=Streptomyces polyasparticus TaxID=2767826 RepID=A0ABR7SWU1_9ACTN|nr:hypothetical protein [Streptomyces polyasparticus]MBC9718991.1 hypothetical protein [Streptomyces polyasparticus]
MGHTILERTAEIVSNGATETELAFLVARLTEALRDALAVAECRGERLLVADASNPADGDHGPRWTPPANAFG